MLRVVLDHGPHPEPADHALLLGHQLVHRHLDAPLGGLAEVGVAAGERTVLADHQLVLGGGAASRGGDGDDESARERETQTGA
jgi:hypothetical protein